MKEELICIVCPRGCHLTVDPDNSYEVKGNFCPKGVTYGKAELINPTRMITSTVLVEGGHLTRCPVKTNKPIPKGKIKEAMTEINRVKIKAPVRTGDIIIHHLLGSDVQLLATRDID